jgi:drug/metabolite transporter (DMT)-like permease
VLWTNLIRVSVPSTALAMPLRRWLPGMLGLALIWGSSFLFIKVGVSALHPFWVAFGRVASGAAALLVVMTIQRARLPGTPAAWAHNAVVSVVGIAAPFTLFAYGEQRVSSTLAGIWNSVTPLVVLPLAVFAFRTERMTTRRTVGLALGLVGALVILGVWRGIGGSSLAGQLMCLAAACCYGVSIPYTKRFVAPLPHSGVVMSACQLIIASAVLAVAAPLVSGAAPEVSSLPWTVVGAVVVLGAVGTGLAFVINMRNIRLVGASTASMVTYIIPVFATVAGVVVLHEHLQWFQPIGALVVLVGVAVSQNAFRRRTVVVADPGLPGGPAIEPQAHTDPADGRTCSTCRQR